MTRALAREPADRFQTAAEFAELARAHGGPVTSASPRRRASVAAHAGGAVPVGAAGSFSGFSLLWVAGLSRSGVRAL